MVETYLKQAYKSNKFFNTRIYRESMIAKLCSLWQSVELTRQNIPSKRGLQKFLHLYDCLIVEWIWNGYHHCFLWGRESSGVFLNFFSEKRAKRTLTYHSKRLFCSQSGVKLNPWLTHVFPRRRASYTFSIQFLIGLSCRLAVIGQR